VQFDLIGPSDRVDLLAGFEGLSPRSRYLRFLTSMPELPDFILDGLLKTGPPHHVAIGARMLDSTGARMSPIVGVARYFRSPESIHVAEPAIAVVDELHGLGLGKLLLRRLSATARANGVTHFRAHVLDENRRIKRLLHAAGAEIVEQDDAVLIYDVDIRRTARPTGGVLARLLAAMLDTSKTP
jgi:GNAT superfamily N-acetyltransferase